MESAKPAKIPALPCGLDRLEKAWGLTIKAATVEDVVTEQIGQMKLQEARAFVRLWITLAFASDVKDVYPIRQAFAATASYVAKGQPVPRVGFYLFDNDSVLLKKLFLDQIEGEITGVTGDAFRVSVHCDPELYKTARKIDLRYPATER